MPTPKAKKGSGAKKGLGPETLYDFIMYFVEPDLMTAELPRLEAKYSNETEEEEKERYRSYEEAFRLFDQVLADFSLHLEKGARRMKVKARAEVRKREVKEQKKGIERAEKLLDNSL